MANDDVQIVVIKKERNHILLEILTIVNYVLNIYVKKKNVYSSYQDLCFCEKEKQAYDEYNYYVKLELLKYLPKNINNHIIFPYFL